MRLPFLARNFGELVVRIRKDLRVFDMVDGLEFARIAERNVVGWFLGPRAAHGMEVARLLFDDVYS